ncbi:cation diffusion facilitator family transporter [Nocardioides terrae]|uniref:cation diffusion facilitator family transporter n=1 Tax=Nocardioides terrae TaxID=574651 RepID=UPI001C31AE6E|nr:cation diffusion facilitator family transporter [Nocardioides terrae]
MVAALALLSTFLVAEVVVAVVAGSLALLSDAGHMLTDVAAIALALVAARLASRPAAGAWTFGMHRAEILSAAVNGVTLVAISLVVAVEAVRRLLDPPGVSGWPVVATALVGCLVNIAVAWLLARADRRSLNVEGAFQHVLTDLYGFVGTLVAGLVILATGWTRADPIASLLVVALMLRAGWRLLRDSGRILLEAAPADTDLALIRSHLLGVPHVREVHDLHVWTVTSALPALSAHVVVDQACFADGHAPQILDQIQACLAGHFDVEHSTFQLEPPGHAQHEAGAHS